MYTFLFDICVAIVSLISGIDLKEIKKVFDKGKTENVENLEISESIDIVSKKLEESKKIIDVALLEMEK